MAMMDLVHVWFRPFRDELSLRRDDGRAAQNGKGTFRRKFGETSMRRIPDGGVRNTRARTTSGIGNSSKRSRATDGNRRKAACF